MFDCFECGYYKFADGGCQCDHTCPHIEDDPFCLAIEEDYPRLILVCSEDYDESDF